MNIDQVSRDLVSKHWGAVDFDKLIAAEMRKLQEETLDEAARECDGKALSADAAAADFDQSIDIILEHKDRARSARALAKRIRSLKKHPPTQPDAQTEQPMHMQNGLTLEQREWIRAEIACALESRPAAPTSKADALLAEVVRVAGLYNGIYADAERWRGTDLYPLARALTAAREYVEAQGKATAPPPTTGEREVPDARTADQEWFDSEAACWQRIHDGRMQWSYDNEPRMWREINENDARADRDILLRRLIAQRSPLSPEAKGEGTVDVEALRAQKDAAYAERDRLVCALSKVFPSWLARHPDSDKSWDDDWRWIVFVQLPTGQSSWHIKYDELTWFDHLERRASNDWDGHTTEEKYARLARLTGGAK